MYRLMVILLGVTLLGVAQTNQVDIHAIVTFNGPQPTVEQLCAAATTGMNTAGIPFTAVHCWNGASESITGWRVSTVFNSPGPTLNQQKAAVEAGLVKAGWKPLTIAVYHHPLPPGKALTEK